MKRRRALEPIVAASLIVSTLFRFSWKSRRSTGPAIFAGGWALEQLWLFWVAPLIGGALGGLIYPLIAGNNE